MKRIRVRPVESARDRRVFLTFPWRIYRNDPVWVPPLLSERAARIDPARGPFFKAGEAEFFIAWRNKEPVGTMSAAEDRARNEYISDRECTFGFFECVNDYAVAEALFETAADWAKQRGLTSLNGPFDLDREDSYGILIEGHDRPQVVLCGHTPPYYQELVERYGFESARGDNVAFEIDLTQFQEEGDLPSKLLRVARIVQRRGRVSVRGGRMDEWDEEIDRVLKILNAGLAVLRDFSPWSPEGFRARAEAMRAIMDPELVLFGEVDGEPVGWLAALPNVNEALQHANGLRYPWDYISLWWHMRRRPECLAIKSIAVVPEYWGRGVDALMFYEMGRRALAKGYEWADFSLTSEENPMTPLLAKNFGLPMYRRYRVYKKML